MKTNFTNYRLLDTRDVARPAVNVGYFSELENTPFDGVVVGKVYPDNALDKQYVLYLDGDLILADSVGEQLTVEQDDVVRDAHNALKRAARAASQSGDSFGRDYYVEIAQQLETTFPPRNAYNPEAEFEAERDQEESARQ